MNQTNTAQARHVRRMLAVGALLFLGVYAWWGARSVNFGHDVDDDMKLRLSAEAVESGILLPRFYYYPSGWFWTALAQAGSTDAVAEAPRAVADLRTGHAKDFCRRVFGAGGRARLAALFHTREYLLRTRFLFFCFSLGTLVATWLGAFVLARRNAWVATAAMLALASSWEFFYHSLHYAPDGPATLFGSATLWCIVVSWRTRDAVTFRRWLLAGAVAAGLACGFKYNAGIFLLPVLLARWLAPAAADESWGLRLRRELGLGLVFGLVCLVMTPGMLLEPYQFVSHLYADRGHYYYGHGGYTVAAGRPHYFAMLEYLALVFCSPLPWLAFPVFAVILAGGVMLWWRDRRLAVVLGSVLILYPAYVGTVQVMFVRNLLFLGPPAMLLFAHAVDVILPMARNIWTKVILGLLLVSPAAYGLWFIAGAAGSINTFRSADLGSALNAFLQRNRTVPVCLSPELKNLTPGGTSSVDRAALLADPRSVYLFLSWEISAGDLAMTDRLAANKFGRYRVVAGARDVNFDYYPTWVGARPKLVAVSYLEAERLGLVGLSTDRWRMLQTWVDERWGVRRPSSP